MKLGDSFQPSFLLLYGVRSCFTADELVFLNDSPEQRFEIHVLNYG